MKDQLNIPGRIWDGKQFLNDEENRMIEDRFDEFRIQDGNIDVWQFTKALETFLSSPIQESLQSPNPLIRLLAILDRRTGKRTLEKMKDSIDKEPNWLQYFYKLRLQA